MVAKVVPLDDPRQCVRKGAQHQGKVSGDYLHHVDSVEIHLISLASEVDEFF